MKIVNVLKRDVRNRPIQATVRDESSPVEVVVERTLGLEWRPLYGLKNDKRVELPSCFSLNSECLTALDEAK